MITPFFGQVLLWTASATLSAVAVMQYYSFRFKERRLPLACEYNDLEQRIGLRKQELDQLAKQVAKAHEVIGESHQKLGEVASNQRWLDGNRGELLKVESERKQQEAMRADLIALQGQLRTLQVELGSVGNEVAKQNAQLSSISTQRSNLAGEVDGLRHQFDEVNRQIADKTLSLNAIINDINLKTVDQSRLQEQLATTTEFLGKAREQFDKLVGEIDAAKRELADTQRQHHSLQMQCQTLKDEIRSLEIWKATLTALLTQLQANVDRLDPKTAGANRYKDLWEPCSFAPLPAIKSQWSEATALANTEAYLKSHGLYYHRRVVNAFHAALKTADLSPLVVLAGISGTGKSLLPKRYAEAMGMHMVTLAVQPRWDSPQDLFGFFNHLEGRYKATELARAMVQFERHNRSSWGMPAGWKHGREDRMLLVLLDEMNLARVEYYFSEFLSKLETRRDVNEGDNFDRAKAEITLDMGSLREDERNIRLFPGRNVLFTGTMNEDESTQSLSDKVIDRACVMRFGRPNKLEIPSAAAEAPQNAGGLTFDTWLAWCENDLTANDERTVNQWIKSLNDGMDLLGKPFAHRVHQAILAYARHYPRHVGQEHLKLALADQIEQRILPKLRGMELEGNEEGMEAIKRVIFQASDAPLSAAFDKAMDSRTGTFLWRGLDRSEA